MARLTAPDGTTRASRHSQVAVPAAGTALLLIDVIDDLAFDGSDALIEQAQAMAEPLARLKRRAAVAGVPKIYINDNFGQWQVAVSTRLKFQANRHPRTARGQ